MFSMNVWKTRHYMSDRGGQPTANSKSLVQRQRRTDDQVSWVGNAAQDVGDNWHSVVAVYWRWYKCTGHCQRSMMSRKFWVRPAKCGGGHNGNSDDSSRAGLFHFKVPQIKMTWVDKKLSYRRETARCFVSLNISLSHSKVIRNDTPWVARV